MLVVAHILPMHHSASNMVAEGTPVPATSPGGPASAASPPPGHECGPDRSGQRIGAKVPYGSPPRRARAERSQTPGLAAQGENVVPGPVRIGTPTAQRAQSRPPISPPSAESNTWARRRIELAEFRSTLIDGKMDELRTDFNRTMEEVNQRLFAEGARVEGLAQSIQIIIGDMVENRPTIDQLGAAAKARTACFEEVKTVHDVRFEHVNNEVQHTKGRIDGSQSLSSRSSRSTKQASSASTLSSTPSWRSFA